MYHSRWKTGYRRICIIIALAVIIAAAYLLSDSTSYTSKTGFYFDTVITINIPSKQEALLDECFLLCADMEKTFSRTDKSSELFKLNNRTAKTVRVSKDLAGAIALGLEYSKKTGGHFDITVGGISDLWDFHSENGKVPPKKDIDTALKHVGYEKVVLNGDTVTLEDDETKIDLGAIAKGYIADRIKELLISGGARSALINLGGNILTIGRKFDGSSWQVGIKKPFADNEYLEVLEVDDRSVVSSGTYERCFEADGKVYHHIFDALTGYPADVEVSQVTIVSDMSVMGDILSTACILLGIEESKEFLKGEKYSEAIFSNETGVAFRIKGSG